MLRPTLYLYLNPLNIWVPPALRLVIGMTYVVAKDGLLAAYVAF